MKYIIIDSKTPWGLEVNINDLINKGNKVISLGSLSINNGHFFQSLLIEEAKVVRTPKSPKVEQTTKDPVEPKPVRKKTTKKPPKAT